MQKSHISKAQLRGARPEQQAEGRQAEERGLHVGTTETPGRAVRGRREPGDELGDRIGMQRDRPAAGEGTRGSSEAATSDL